VGAKVTLAETNPGSNVRLSAIAVAAVGVILGLPPQHGVHPGADAGGLEGV